MEDSRGPYIIIEAAQPLAIPMEAVEIDVAPTSTDSLQEVFQPTDALRSGGDTWATTADSSFAQRFYGAEPFSSGYFGGDVGLVGQFGFLKCD